MKKGNPLALLPIGVFIVLYLGIGLMMEYGLKIHMGFYNIPIVAIFLVAIFVACLQNRKTPFDEKLAVMAKGLGNKDIITMLLIFLEAGAFVGVVGRAGVQSVAYCMMSFIPAQYAVAVMFVASCFISLAMGTSVGTITLLTPIAVEVAVASGNSVELCIATVIGGAMFGDNLSLISDTTIAACNGQGCPMSAKFKGNIMIALPAAIAALVMIFLFSEGEGARQIKHEYDLLMIVPYVLVLAGGVAGINVFLVLLAGIVSGAAIAIGTGSVVPAPGQNVFSQLLGNIGGNMSGMFETCIVVVLVSAMCALIREHGGFDAILYYIRRLFRGRRGGQLGIGIMVAALDVATANNTVAIVMSNPIAKELSEEYGIEPSRTACLLDTFSCITQGVIPYGAQLLVAIAAAAEMDYTVSAFRLIPLLFYPMFLLVSSLIAIAVSGRKKAA